MTESLAVRWRPKRFADVAGQRHVTAVLRAAAARTKPPQQILLAGPSGLGKTTTARIFAAALMCEFRTPDGDACTLCDSCQAITDGSHPDVLEMDAASNGGKDEIRELASRASLAPLRGKWKVYIVDEAHGLTGPGGQAFLRLLEEPPGHCIFILATTDPEKLPVALRGRCVNLEVLPPTTEQAIANLHRVAAGENWDHLTDDVARAVLAASDPALGMRGTVMTLDKLSGVLDEDRPLGAGEVEALLGVVAPSRLSDLTAAVESGDRAGAVAKYLELQAGPGRGHLRAQLTQWAYERMQAAAATGSGFDDAFYCYSTLVEAPRYDGAFTVAVARATSGHLSATVEGVRALLERAEATLGALADATKSDRKEVPAPTPQGQRVPDASKSTQDIPATQVEVSTVPARLEEPERLSEDATSSSPADTHQTAESDPLDVKAPQLVALLNSVGKVSGAAALLLRRCPVRLSPDGTYEVSLAPGLHPKAAACDLAGVLAKVTAGGTQVRLM